ncbi:hypothetical protein [Xanthomonas phage Tabio]|nr:hypothetical protein [Xanthomonas phage Tabio]CAA2393673.1 Phage protein [Xanthomonas phage Sopo]CAA2409798.1 hypothetical protein [Xanthomonas phage Tenjo]
MFTNNSLSTLPQPSAFVEQVSRRTIPLVDYEMGGVAINDAAQGLQVQLWKVEVLGTDVWLSAPSVPAFLYFSRPDISEVALAFDQNMRPFVAFVQNGVAWLYWYDTQVSAMVFSSFTGAITPRLTTDEKRAIYSSNSDVILAYVRANNLYFRMQRERFQIEHLLASGVNATLVAIGMNRGNRLQFRLRPTPP